MVQETNSSISLNLKSPVCALIPSNEVANALEIAKLNPENFYKNPIHPILSTTSWNSGAASKYSSPMSSNLETGAMVTITRTFRVFRNQNETHSRFIQSPHISINAPNFPILPKHYEFSYKFIIPTS